MSYASSEMSNATGYARIVKFVAFPLAFWGLGALSWYYTVKGGPVSNLKTGFLFAALLLAFFWIGVSGQRKGAWSRLYLGVVFGLPVILSGAASASRLI